MFAWKRPAVIEFWSVLGEMDKLRNILADGCQFGVEHKGQRIQKPWRIRVTDARNTMSCKTCTCSLPWRRTRADGTMYCGMVAKSILEPTEMAFGAEEVKKEAL